MTSYTNGYGNMVLDSQRMETTQVALTDECVNKVHYTPQWNVTQP